MQNFKLTIQYDGTNYCGWQIQKNSPSVQQTIKDKIEILLKEPINLIGAGRTDSGAHALGQTANFKSNRITNIQKFLYSLNSILPEDIAVSKIEEVSENFNSRFSANKRHYIYLLRTQKDPFFNRFSYLHREQIDTDYINSSAEILKGVHNFRQLCRYVPKLPSYDCIFSGINCKQKGHLYVFSITSNRFLFGMIRTIIGTLLRMETNNDNPNLLNDLLMGKENPYARFIVPAKGLILRKVEY